MGAWDVEPWDTDEAADWFGDFFRDLKVDEIHSAFQHYDDYDKIRAACYVLQTLGRVYVWPASRLDDLKPLLEKGIELLSNMIHPPDDDWDFLEEWDDNPDVIKSVERQIEELKARRAGIA